MRVTRLAWTMLLAVAFTVGVFAAPQGAPAGKRPAASAQKPAPLSPADIKVIARGSAWPQHMNKTVAETMQANIEKVGTPKKKSYFDPTKYKTYLEQLGIAYPPPEAVK